MKKIWSNRGGNFIEYNYEEQEKVDFEKSIVFQTNDSFFWPVPYGFRAVANMYNLIHNNEKDYLPVIIQGMDQTKALNRIELVQGIMQKLDNNDQEIPNLIAGDALGLQLLKEKDKLLKFRKKDFPFDEIFPEKILKNVVRENAKAEDGLLLMPLALSSTDALLFNLVILKHVFKEIEKGGGIVDHNSELYVKAFTKKRGRQDIAIEKMWKWLVAKSTLIYKDIFTKANPVNDKTFANLRNIQVFAANLHKGLYFDEKSAKKANNNSLDNIKKFTNWEPKIMAVDYANQLFFKDLYQNLVGKSNNPKAYLWYLEDCANHWNQKVVHNFSKENLQAIKDLYKIYYQNTLITQQDSPELKDGKFNFVSTYYANHELIANANWSHHHVREMDNMISFGPAVGLCCSYASDMYYPSTVPNPNATAEQKELAAHREQYFAWKINATYDDRLYKSQINQFEDGGTKIYDMAGTNLLAIKTSKKRNQATIKFLKWLFNAKVSPKVALETLGRLDYHGYITKSDEIGILPSLCNIDYETQDDIPSIGIDYILSSISTYVVPTKKQIALNDQKQKELQVAIDEIQKLSDIHPQNPIEKSRWSRAHKIYVAAHKQAISAQDLADVINPKNKALYLLPAQDVLTSWIVRAITEALFTLSAHDLSTKMSPEKLMNNIAKILEGKELDKIKIQKNEIIDNGCCIF